MNSNLRLGGNICAIVTPFDKNGRVDYESHARHLDWLIAHGIDGVVTVGTTGESPTVSFQEHEELIKFVIRFVNNRVPVIAGIGGNSTDEAVRLTKFARQAGANAGLSVVPYYNKPNQEGLFEHFTDVCQAGDGLPIILYNVPGRTVADLKPETILSIRDKVGDVLAGIKEASSNLGAVQTYVENGLSVFCGEDGLNFPMLALGVSGIISVVSNFNPTLVSNLIRAVNDDDLTSARELNVSMVALSKVTFIDTNPIPVKFICACLGLITSECLRLPLTPLNQTNRNIVRETLTKFNH